MKLNLSFVVSLITITIGLLMSQSIFVPITVLIASVIDLLTREWVMSEKVGTAVGLSIILKFIFSAIGMYALLGILINIILIFIWIF